MAEKNADGAVFLAAYAAFIAFEIVTPLG